MNVLVFDIETVPDVELGARLYDMQGMEREDIANAMTSKRLQKTGSDFLPLHMQQVVAISAVMRRGDNFKVWSLADEDAGEKEIVQRFFDGLDRFTPTLVSWNGSGFDLPVLHYRALKHGVQAGRYWDVGDDDREFKWNNYLSRYHWRHVDLMDVLAAFNLRAASPLDEIAVMLGFPGKLGMSGSKVAEYFAAGKVAEIRQYCETDVLNTYLVYLRWLLVKGTLTEALYDHECDRVKAELGASGQAHLQEFLDAWQA